MLMAFNYMCGCCLAQVISTQFSIFHRNPFSVTKTQLAAIAHRTSPITSYPTHWKKTLRQQTRKKRYSHSNLMTKPVAWPRSRNITPSSPKGQSQRVYPYQIANLVPLHSDWACLIPSPGSPAERGRGHCRPHPPVDRWETTLCHSDLG